MEVNQGTQIGPDGERYPIGEVPEDTEVNGLPVRIVSGGGGGGGGTIEGPIELDVGDIEIGAVELKDASTSARATISGGNLSVIDSAGNVLLTAIDGHVDGLETLLTTIDGHVDGIEGSVDGLEALIGTTNTTLTTIDGRVDGLEGLVGTTNTTLATIDSRVDGVETLLTAIDGHVDGIEGSVDGIETLIGTTNTSLTTIDGHVDGLEGVTGTTADAAVDTDANGTLSAKLRGLIKFFRDRTGTTVPATNAEGLSVREVPTAGTWANGAQTAVTSTQAQILASNTARKAALIQNVGLNAIRIGVTGVTATTGWISLPAGATVQLAQPFCPTAALFAIRESADSTVLASEIV